MVITLNVKVTDDVLYTKLMYDPDGGNAWVADIFSEASMKLYMASPTEAASGRPYSIEFAGHTASDNIKWSATPIALRAGRQVVMRMTGIVINEAGVEPITVTLVNQKSSYA
jgi:hypothetical protein